MSANVCVCRFCVDPREHGHSLQHGLELYNGIYTNRVKGSFVSRPLETGEISTTAIMLLELGKHPTFMLQGHRDCAAVKVLFNSYGKQQVDLTNTELEFRRSHQEALLAVKKMAGHLDEKQQLSLLEQACVLQSINNLFSFADIRARIGTKDCPAFYAYYSLTPELAPGEILQPEAAEKIELKVFDYEQGLFVRPDTQPGSNRGFRISDLIDTRTFLPQKEKDCYRIQEPVNLEQVISNQMQPLRSLDKPNFSGIKDQHIA